MRAQFFSCHSPRATKKIKTETTKDKKEIVARESEAVNCSEGTEPMEMKSKAFGPIMAATPNANAHRASK